MATNLALDDELIEEARRIGKYLTKKGAVTAALDEYIRRRKQQEIVKLFGMVAYGRGYGHKANRRRDRIEYDKGSCWWIRRCGHWLCGAGRRLY